MKQGLALLVTIFFSFYLSIVIAGASENKPRALSDLDQLANEALYFVQMERYKDAQKVMSRIETVLNEADYFDLYLSMDERRVIHTIYQEVLKTMENDLYDPSELLRVLTKFRLAIDALSTNYEPLWVHMEETVLDAFQTVKDAVIMKDGNRFQMEFYHFLSVYDMLYPSILLDVPADKVEKVMSQIQYIEQYSDELLLKENRDKEMDNLQLDLESLFEKAKEDEADPSLWWVIISTGGIIIFTLTYVGWRKYAGEKKRLQKLEKEKKRKYHK